MTYTLRELGVLAEAMELSVHVSNLTAKWEIAIHADGVYVAQAMSRRLYTHPSGNPTDWRVGVVWSSAEWRTIRALFREMAALDEKAENQ